MGWANQHNPHDDDFARHAKAMVRDGDKRVKELIGDPKPSPDPDQKEKKSGLGIALGVAFILILILIARGS